MTRVRTFTASSEREAVRQAVEALGRDALILKMERVQPKGFWKMSGRQRVELQACAPPPRPMTPTAPEPQAQVQGRLQRGLGRAYGAPPPRPGQDLGARVEAVSEQMAQMKGMLQELARGQKRGDLPDLAESLQEHYATLVEREVAEGLARGLVRQVNEALRGEELKNPVLVRTQLRQCLERMIRHAGPIAVPGDRTRVVALVGPTGSGKTTTIAKLATHFHYVQGKRVGLVTVDTYRMGAKEQLQQYADLLGLPLAVALTPGELRQAVRAMADRDLVLIDTAGYGQRELLKFNEVRAFLSAARPDEVHLVLPCTTRSRTLKQILEVYRTLPFDRILLTKMDEAAALGCVLDVLALCEQGISYVTDGQEVTEAIRAGEPGRLAAMILGEAGT